MTVERERQNQWRMRAGILITLLMVESGALSLMSGDSTVFTSRLLLLVSGATLGLLTYSLNRLFFYRAQVLYGAWAGMREAVEGIRNLDHLAGEASLIDDKDITDLEQYLERDGWRHVWTAVGIGSAGGLLLAIAGLSMNVPIVLWCGQFALLAAAVGGVVLRVYNRIRHRYLIRQVERLHADIHSSCAPV